MSDSEKKDPLLFPVPLLFVEKALAKAPDDEQLLQLQAKAQQDADHIAYIARSDKALFTKLNLAFPEKLMEIPRVSPDAPKEEDTPESHAGRLLGQYGSGILIGGPKPSPAAERDTRMPWERSASVDAILADAEAGYAELEEMRKAPKRDPKAIPEGLRQLIEMQKAKGDGQKGGGGFTPG